MTTGIILFADAEELDLAGPWEVFTTAMAVLGDGRVVTIAEHDRPVRCERRRYVRDGNLVTAAGVSAGIDMALWLVGEMHGPDFARTVQHWIEYDPAPPYAAEV
jgi:putative intracellular protease/amidase